MSTSSFFWDEHKHSSRGDARQTARHPPLSPDALVSVSSQSSLQWVPPKNCVRIAGTEANAHRFFPLELTSCDYVTRVFRIVASVLSMLCEAKESTAAPSIIQQQGSADSNKSTVGAPSSLSSFLRICETHSRVVEDNHKSACELLMRAPAQTTPLMQSLVGIYQSEVSMTSCLDLSLDQGRLTDLSELFRASKSLIHCLLVEPAGDRYQPSPLQQRRLVSEGIVDSGRASSSSSSYLLAELQRLEEQHFSHISFKERRMAKLGWAWQEAAEVSVASMRIDTASPSERDAGSSSQSSSSQLLLRDASELQAQLRDLVKPSCQANILLLYRLIYIAQDLDILMRTLAEDGEYTEAQRIRDLKTAMDRTVSSQGRSFLDLVEQSCVQAQLLAAELRSCVEATTIRATTIRATSATQNNNSFSELLDCEDMIGQLLSLRLQLHSLSAPFSLLSQPEYVELLCTQGSKVINADFIFTAPHGGPSPLDHHRHHRSDSTSIVTIGSLIIVAGSYSILNAVLSSWPNFSSLKARVSLSNAHSFRDDDADAAASNHQLFDFMSSPILPSADPLTCYPTPPPHPHHSAPGVADIDMDDSGFELRLSPQQPPHSQLDRTAAAFFARRFNGVGFSPAILNVLISFEELQLQLRQLLELPSAALNELLLRFVGISSDLLQLSDMNISIGNLPESDRLLMLRDAVDSSIDADLQDDYLDEKSSASMMVCGRGRSRLSDLDTLVRQVKVGRRELQRVAGRARLEKDFTGAHALDAVAADLSKSLNRLQQSMLPFSLLSVEDDLNISSDDVGQQGMMEINDRIARDGSSFITADFLFNFSNSSRHSIASLAVIAGAGAILRHVRNSWPGLTALKARGGGRGGGGGAHNGLTDTDEGGAYPWDHQLTDEGQQQGSVGSSR